MPSVQLFILGYSNFYCRLIHGCPSKKTLSQTTFPQLKVFHGCPHFNTAPEGLKLSVYPDVLLLYVITMVPANVHFSKFLSSPHRPMSEVLPLPFALIIDEGSCQRSNNPHPAAPRPLMDIFFCTFKECVSTTVLKRSIVRSSPVCLLKDCKLKGGKASNPQERI